MPDLDPRRSRAYIILGLAVLLVVLAATSLPILLSRAYSNVGMVFFRDGLVTSTHAFGGPFPYAGHLAGTSLGARSAAWLRRAVAFDHRSATTAWAAERVCIATGDCQGLTDQAQDAKDGFNSFPLEIETHLLNLSLHNEPEEVLAFYNRVGQPQSTRIISDTIALAYLDLAWPLLERNDKSGLDYLRQALTYRPFDLYANMMLARWAKQSGDTESMIAHQARYLRFPIEAIAPANRRLTDYMSKAVAAFAQDGSWSDELALSVSAFLVWRASEMEGVRHLVDEISSMRPDQSGWPALAEEIQMRRGEPSPARPSKNAPNALDFIHQMIGEPDISQGYLLQVAKLLQIDSKDLVVGQNLLPQGDFEKLQAGKISGWTAFDYATGPSALDPHAALFVGTDSFNPSGEQLVRIQGFWIEDSVQTGFFGVVSHDENQGTSYAINVEPQHPYIVSGVYRTVGSMTQADVYLGNPDVGLLEEPLLPTEGAWTPFFFVGCHSAESAQKMQLLLRLRGPGIVWFDHIQVRQVTGKTIDHELGIRPECQIRRSNSF
jgi:hypothetical protein